MAEHAISIDRLAVFERARNSSGPDSALEIAGSTMGGGAAASMARILLRIGYLPVLSPEIKLSTLIGAGLFAGPALTTCVAL